MINRRILQTLVFSSLLLPRPSEAQEWTRFRGPKGAGISAATTVPVTYSPESANWRVQLPGIGHSSPVIWGERLYVTAADDATGKRTLLCLNTKDGKPFWTKTYDYSAYGHHKFHN